MGKSILVIDTPKSCLDCMLAYEQPHDSGVYYCIKKRNLDIEEYETQRHPQCPLQDTTELLEALEELDKAKKYAISKIGIFTKDGEKEKLETAYNKLHKALGGNDSNE